MIKYILILRLFFIFIIFCNSHEYNPDGWNEASESILEKLNKNANPCEDFYGFVCGTLSENETEAGKIDDDSLAMDANYAHALLNASLLEVNESYPNHSQWLKIFYDKCKEHSYTMVDDFLKDIHSKLVEHFFPSIEDIILGMETSPNPNDSFWQFVGVMQRELNSRFLIYSSVEISEINCVKKPVLHLNPGVPPPEENLVHFAKLLVTKILQFDWNETVLNSFITELTNFQVDLRRMYDSSTKSDKDDENTQLKLKIKDLHQIASLVSWDSYFQGLLPANLYDVWIKNDPQVVMHDANYFQQLSSLQTNHSIEAAVNLAYTLLIYNLFTNYKLATITNSLDANVTLEEVCLDMAFQKFGPASAALVINYTYAKNVDEWKYDVELIAEAVISAFRFIINGMDWIDSEDKMALTKKVNLITLHTGIPEWLKYDADIDRRTPQYDSNLTLLENDIFAQKRLFLQEMQPLFGATLLEDLSPNFENKAYYSQFNINVLFGLLISPLYTFTDPLALKFGSIGWAIARELLRAFDDLHIMEVPEGVDKWLKNDTLKMFRHKTACQMESYANYYGLDSHPDWVKGRSVKEMVLNAEALKIAYTAYRFTTQTIGREPPLPNLVKYSGDQIFFITAGQTFCIDWSKDPEDLYAKIPAEDKIMFTITKNSMIFSDVFNCKKSMTDNSCAMFTSLNEKKK